MYGMYKGQANILIPNPRDLPAVIKELRKYQPSFFPAVNTLFNALVNNEEFKQLDHSNLKWQWRWYGSSAIYSRSLEENYWYHHY